MLTEFLQVLANSAGATGVYCLLALGLTMSFGVARLVNFAHGDFMVFGALVSASLIVMATQAGSARASVLGFIGMVLVGMSATALLAGAAERTVFKGAHRDGATALVVSIGLTFILQNLMTKIWTTEGEQIPPVVEGALTLVGARVPYTTVVILAVATTAIATYFVVLRFTTLGAKWRAMSEDAVAAELMGVSVDFHRSVNFIIGTALAGLAGGLLLLNSPITPVTGHAYIAIAFSAVVIGGLGHPLGALVGAAFIALSQSFAGTYLDPKFINAVAMVAIVGVLLVRPMGIWGTRQEL